MSERLAVLLQYLLPKQAITTFAGLVCFLACHLRDENNVIPWFIRRYGVNMAEAANADPLSYPTFNQFFNSCAAPRRAPAGPG